MRQIAGKWQKWLTKLRILVATGHSSFVILHGLLTSNLCATGPRLICISWQLLLGIISARVVCVFPVDKEYGEK